VNPDAVTNQPPVREILGARVTEPGKPLERNMECSPVFQVDHELAVDDLDPDCSWLFRCRNAHATSPGNRNDAESPIV
jgi:hypothetical protein